MGVAKELHVWLLLVVLPFLFMLSIPFLYGLWFMYCLGFIYFQLLNVKWLDAHDKVVYVTGCDSGFGLEVAQQLHTKGCVVFAGCLNLQSDGAKQLAQIQDRIFVVQLDISNEEQVNNVAQQIENYCTEKNLPGLWGLYNNAGIALAGEVEVVPMADFEKGININLFGTLRVTKSVLHLIRPAKGRICTITSGLSRSALYGRSGYCIPKAAADAMMNCLRYEMRKFGVQCSTIAPGNFTAATAVFDNLRRYVKDLSNRIEPQIKRDYDYQGQAVGDPMSPVVDSVLHALLAKNPRARYSPAQWSFLIWWFFDEMLPTDILDACHAHWNKNQPLPECVKKNPIKND